MQCYQSLKDPNQKISDEKYEEYLKFTQAMVGHMKQDDRKKAATEMEE